MVSKGIEKKVRLNFLEFLIGIVFFWHRRTSTKQFFEKNLEAHKQMIVSDLFSKYIATVNGKISSVQRKKRAIVMNFIITK